MNNALNYSISRIIEIFKSAGAIDSVRMCSRACMRKKSFTGLSSAFKVVVVYLGISKSVNEREIDILGCTTPTKSRLKFQRLFRLFKTTAQVHGPFPL